MSKLSVSHMLVNRHKCNRLILFTALCIRYLRVDFLKQYCCDNLALRLKLKFPPLLYKIHCMPENKMNINAILLFGMPTNIDCFLNLPLGL